MTSGPPADLARRFRRLDAERRLAFVAALWTARGWETRVDDDTVLAEKNGVERRIRVFAPGWFGSPDLDDADVLVVTEDDDSIRAAAEAQGIRYVAPTDLRNRLLYGLARPDAERLAQTYLDCSVTTNEEGGETPRFGALSSLSSPPRLGDRLPDPSRLAVVVLVVLLVGLAAASPGLFRANDAPAPAQTTNGSYTPGNVGAIGATGSPAGTVGTDANLPPGVSQSGLQDVAELANATGTAMEEQGWALRVHREGHDETVWRMGGSEWTQTITASSETVYYNRFRMTYAGSNRSSTTVAEAYGDGERVYQRFESTDDGPRYSRVPADEATHVQTTISRVETAVVVYLTTSETAVECVGRHEGTDDCFAYRVTATGTPTILSGDVENYTATATVSDAGLVTELLVEYTVRSPTDDGSWSRVHFGWGFDSFGEVDVSEPSWLPEAQSRTTSETSTRGGSDASTTGTPSPAGATDPKTDSSNATRTASS